MTKDKIASFLSACAKAEREEPAKSIEAGASLWLLGSPAAATDGMVGLATTPTQTIYLRPADVRDAHETDGRFLIRIAADANLLVREEQVLKLSPGRCQCSEPGELRSKKPTRPDAPRPGPIIVDCTPVCSFETVCSPYEHPDSGAVIVVCWPQLVCRNPCEGTPA